MRVVTFNLLHGRSMTDGAVDLDRFQQGIASLDADVLALQEVDRHQPRSREADLARLAAEAMGAVEHRFVATMHGRPVTSWGPARTGAPPGTPAYGVALLSRVPVASWEVLQLPVPGRRVPHREQRDLVPVWVREEPRVAVVAHVETPTGPATVVGTHLSFTPWTNGRQLRSLRRSLAARPGPLLLLGDLNMGVRRALRLTGLTSLVSAPTFPAAQPVAQLDHVLAPRRNWQVRSAGAVAMPFSDHRALAVDLDPTARLETP